MPIEKKPANPVGKSYVPPSSEPYKVKDGGSWVTVARAHGINVWDLIYANFRTKDPAEVNWYLRHYVGCVRSTVDGKNWMFSSKAKPGIIHIPQKVSVIEMPPLIIHGRVPSKLGSVWAGIGKSHSGDLFVIGAFDITARIYNLGDDMSRIRNATININGWKFGPGLGGSVEAVFVIAHGYETAGGMNGVTGDWDFDIAIGGKLSSVLKGVKGIGRAVDTLEKYKKTRYITEQAIKNMGITRPGVYTIPIPLAGGGIHLWGGYKFGDVTVVGTGEGIP